MTNYETQSLTMPDIRELASNLPQDYELLAKSRIQGRLKNKFPDTKIWIPLCLDGGPNTQYFRFVGSAHFNEERAREGLQQMIERDNFSPVGPLHHTIATGTVRDLHYLTDGIIAEGHPLYVTHQHHDILDALANEVLTLSGHRNN